jgi:hypothetical protein
VRIFLVQQTLDPRQLGGLLLSNGAIASILRVTKPIDVLDVGLVNA